ncbi:50S ribosomal protein L11 methyltransferase [Crossiella sp. CA-258035]|uniref:50S ribosomal protein L11 methyltransferase n=1 Tax=Crossiella sp. CA-258035 TaxID=2981138 RepID=UPI0024BC026A|nr:50S ribosomal protein L11 methyltransferase [Crossiella sp. CA-258035]WHT18413.1 50S ribosomal protein L11 methyltransferase [Crossiella sp. CA-258035]
MTGSAIARLTAPDREVLVRTRQLGDPAPALLVPSLGEYPVYDDRLYHFMLDDQLRNDRYAAAIARHAPGRTVLDIGTGQEAVWALAAARAGARHVWAVEVLPEAARQARETVSRAGFADRVTVLEGLSTEVHLPERADVCVSEIIGNLGGAEGAGAVLRDARDRLVRRDGVFIPHRSATTVVALDLDHAAPGGRPGFAELALPYLEHVFSSVGRPFDVRACIPALRRRAHLSGAAEVEPLDFGGELVPESSQDRELVITRRGTLHGFALGVRLWVSAAESPIDSLTQRCNWFPVYAPLSAGGLPVTRGDRLTFSFSTTLSNDGVHPDYRLDGHLHTASGSVPLSWTSTHHDDGFRANSFYRALFPMAGSPGR